MKNYIWKPLLKTTCIKQLPILFLDPLNKFMKMFKHS